jgi:hypothetical protein
MVGWHGEVNTGVWWGRLREGDPMEDLGVDAYSRSGMGGMDWFYQAWGRDRWWVLVNVLMNLRVA